MLGGGAVRAIWLTITMINQFQQPIINYVRNYEFVHSVVPSCCCGVPRHHLISGMRQAGRVSTKCWFFFSGTNHEALIDRSLVISGTLAPPLSECKWVTFRRASSGSSGRWAVTVMGWKLAWINIPWSGPYLFSTASNYAAWQSPAQKMGEAPWIISFLMSFQANMN